VLVDKTLTVTDRGGTREITLEEALQQQTYQDALAGQRMAIREVLKWIKKREAWRTKREPKAPEPKPIRISPDPDNADAQLWFWASRHPIPPARIFLPIGLSFSSSHGRFRLPSAAGEAANV
jgi:hypothetical protein